MENITDADYTHAKRVCKDFETKFPNSFCVFIICISNILEEFYDLYVERDTLLLAGVFENFRNMWLEIYKLDPDHFLLHWFS